MKLTDFVPPIMASFVRSIMHSSKMKQYKTYEQALNYCTNQGYEDSDIIEVVVEKTRRYRDMLIEKNASVQLDATKAYSLCSLLSCIQSQELRVLDFGGAAGAHYFLARALLPSSFKLKWVVVETPAMVAGAGKVLSCDGLSFSSDLIDAANLMGRIDLLHSSGTLQCVDNPYDYLRKLVSVSADHILFNRLGLTKGSHEVITVHESWLSGNGPGPMPSGIKDKKVRYPFVFPKESVFMEILSGAYNTVATFNDSSGIFSVNNEPIVGFGLLARLSDKGYAPQGASLDGNSTALHYRR